jgi:hypothetical protein
MRIVVVVVALSSSLAGCTYLNPRPPAPDAIGPLPASDAPLDERKRAYEHFRPTSIDSKTTIHPYAFPVGKTTLVGTTSSTRLDGLQLADGTFIRDPRALRSVATPGHKLERDIKAWDETIERGRAKVEEAVTPSIAIGVASAVVGSALFGGSLVVLANDMSQGKIERAIIVDTTLIATVGGGGLCLVALAPVAFAIPAFVGLDDANNAEAQRKSIFASYDLALRERLGLVPDP